MSGETFARCYFVEISPDDGVKWVRDTEWFETQEQAKAQLERLKKKRVLGYQYRVVSAFLEMSKDGKA